MDIFYYAKDYLTASKALAIANGTIKGRIHETTQEGILKSKSIVKEIADGDEAVYGINTGFGPLCTTRISKSETVKLQTNILKSHSVGVGNFLDDTLSLLMMVLKVQALAQGFSGIKEDTLERIIWHIDNQVVPMVPEQGSVGASGDLAPLSHLFLPLIGFGQVRFRGEIFEASEILEKFNLSPITLGPKEGLALINGTQFIAAHAVVAVDRLHNCLDRADMIGAMMVDALRGSNKPFYSQLHELRPFKGNKHVAARIYNFLKGSEILNSHEDCDRVQDPYSLRCMPQVHGASRNAWLHLKELLEVELNSVTDNPIIFNKDLTISGGNFHGQPLAMVLDYAALAASEIGNIADRRIYLAIEGRYKEVPKLLLKDTGINSGYMILQYTSAALASENKSLCHPASADSIPTSLGQEDHVSMGSISGRKALQIIGNVEKIQSIELLTAAQAFEFRDQLRSSEFLEELYEAIRNEISFADEDRVFAEDIFKAGELISTGTLEKVYKNCLQSGKLEEVEIHKEEFQTY
ncbi:histidine ammonia-lyase [Aegicerativicinus sediminis]|uniref:histidine ammonia-lyase n=1 Tax=Aegicerativicinus sediminis TaxID=2893202 RepID=UPI001E4C27CC|nr:histidine ammonia-lyase [Aegicerativicinus sediminis]